MSTRTRVVVGLASVAVGMSAFMMVRAGAEQSHEAAGDRESQVAASAALDVSAASTQSPSAGPASTDEPQSERELDVMDPDVARVNEVVGVLQDLRHQYPAAAGPMSIDYENMRVVQRYVARAQGAEDFMAATRAAKAGPVTIELVPGEFAVHHLESTAERLMTDAAFAKRLLGDEPLGVSYDDEQLMITVAEGSAVTPGRTTIHGVPAEVRVGEAPTMTYDYMEQ